MMPELFIKKIVWAEEVNLKTIYPNSHRCMVIGKTSNGRYVIERQNRDIYTKQSTEIKFLPNCTGWDWKEEKLLTVGCKTFKIVDNNIRLVKDNGESGITLTTVDKARSSIALLKRIGETLGYSMSHIAFSETGTNHYVGLKDLEKFLDL